MESQPLLACHPPVSHNGSKELRLHFLPFLCFIYRISSNKRLGAQLKFRPKWGSGWGREASPLYYGDSLNRAGGDMGRV